MQLLGVAMGNISVGGVFGASGGYDERDIELAVKLELDQTVQVFLGEGVIVVLQASPSDDNATADAIDVGSVTTASGLVKGRAVEDGRQNVVPEELEYA
jgi:hypothetical protein